MTVQRTAPALYRSSAAVSRFNAWFFDAFGWLVNMSLARLKRQVYADLPDTVVEIGAGVGGNFTYYRPGTTVVAIEPNVAMHDRLQKNARDAGVNVVIKETLAEATDLPDDSAKVVISNLVLCTVTDPEAAVAEAHRILEPGGRLIAVEHVRGQGRLLRAVQRLVRRPWQWIFDGCDLERDTLSTIRAGGFSTVKMTERTYATVFLPANSFAYGQAIK